MDDTKRPLIEGIARLFNSSDYADVKICIGQYELPAHSVVLASQSPFFQKALSGNFREGKEKKFVFEDGSLHAHWRVFEYLYTGKYADDPAQVLDAQDDNELVKDARVYLVADFFMLDDLKQIALKKFKSTLERLGRESALLADCIREVYTSTAITVIGLRSAVVEFAHTHRSKLWQKDEFRDLISEGGEFAVHLMSKCIGSTVTDTESDNGWAQHVTAKKPRALYRW